MLIVSPVPPAVCVSSVTT